MTSKNQ